tara:strand:+ start:665 stop:1528 length:864 start_codon:yes stop_codon:yes gene_type:complete
MSNFLKDKQRQPKLYIELPSLGRFYDGSVVQDQQYTQLPVFGMNAMDEILLKTPDALFTGEATVQIIKSCIPAIINPWMLVGYDIDHVLLSIRVATYGDKMPITSKCPKCSSENGMDVNLGKVLETFLDLPTNDHIIVDDLKILLKPLSYKQMTEFSHRQYVFDKQLVQIAQSKDENKDKLQQDVLAQLTNLNLEVAISYITSIQDTTSAEEEQDLNAIKEFILSNDAQFFNSLVDKVKEMSNAWSLPEFNITCNEDGCGTEWKTALRVDYSSFFGTNSFRSRNLTL